MINRGTNRPSEGLSVGFFQQADYAIRICRAFNDYVSERYRKLDSRLHPMGLITTQDVKAAVKELRRLVLDLRLPGVMLPSRGLPLHLGHDYYWPIYEEAVSPDDSRDRRAAGFIARRKGGGVGREREKIL